MSKLPIFYNCAKCPAYCCSYELIQVHDRDLRRLAKRFGISLAAAKRRFTKLDKGLRVLRHHRDEHYGSVCRFLDRESRQCTVYEHRPEICRGFPGAPRCGYYDFLMFERSTQEDPAHVARAYNP
jgi:Fe-S-cluster containining protein